MTLSIIMAILAIVLVILPMYDFKKISILTALLLLIIQITNIFHENNEKTLTEHKIDEIQNNVEPHIDWISSSFQIDFMEKDVNESIAKKINVPFKIYSVNNTVLPNGKINIQSILKNGHQDDAFGYTELSPTDALRLFNAYSKNGTIAYSDEKNANIGYMHLFYKNSIDNIINLSPKYIGKEPLKEFNTLKKLNNTILIVEVPTISNFTPLNIANRLELNLKTPNGEKKIYFNIRAIDLEKKALNLNNFIGIYIPKNYF